MNTFTKFAAAAASFVAFSAAASAANATVYLAFQQDGGAITTVDSGAAVSYAGSFGNFELNVYSGTDGIYPLLLGSAGHNRNTSGDAGVLDIYVTVDDIAGPMPNAFISSFAVNTLPEGWTVQLRTYADAGNGTYGGSLLADQTFSSIDTFVGQNAGPGSAGPYSVTARYTITAPTGGEALANVAITAVPEPATWALMIAGFGGAGAMIRTRRRQAALA